MTRSIWTRADEPPPGRTRRLSQPSASPDRSLAAAGPGRKCCWGLSLLGVTEPKCFASFLRQQPGSSPGLLGKGFLACVRQPPRCPLRTGHGSPTVSGCGDPGGHEAPAQSCRSSVQTTHRLPVCPREGGPVLHSLALSANTYRFLTKRQRPALRVRDDRAPHRVPRALSAPSSAPSGCRPHRAFPFQLWADACAQIQPFSRRQHPSWETPEVWDRLRPHQQRPGQGGAPAATCFLVLTGRCHPRRGRRGRRIPGKHLSRSLEPFCL